MSGPEKGCFVRVNTLIFLARVKLRNVAENVNEGQLVDGSKTLPPHELVQVAGDHFLGCSIHPFEYSFSPLPITFHAIGMGSCDGIHKIPAMICRFMVIVPG